MSNDIQNSRFTRSVREAASPAVRAPGAASPCGARATATSAGSGASPRRIWAGIFTGIAWLASGVCATAATAGCTADDAAEADSGGTETAATTIPHPPSTNPPAATITAKPVMPVSALPNGGAETTTGWTFTAGAALAANGSAYVAANPAAPQGTSVVRIQNDGSAALSVNLSAPGSFRIHFKVAQRKQGATNNRQILRVNVGTRDQVDVFQPASSTYEERVTRPFSAAAGATTVTFTGLATGGDNTALLDDVRIERVRDWRVASSWSPERVPSASDNVSIPEGASMSLTGDCVAGSVNVAGELLATTSDAALHARWVLVRGASALFEVGRERSPFLQRFTLELTGDRGDTENILEAGTKFLMAEMMGRIELHGNDEPQRRSWTKLGATAAIGATTLTLSENVSWKKGDEIVIAPSVFGQEPEQRTLAEDAEGRTITLTAPLQLRHHGAAPQTYSRATSARAAKTWTLDERAEVGLLTRNIKVVGDAQSTTNGFGGHMMVMYCESCRSSGEAHVEGVELTRMGQKQRLGRYPMHWHMLGQDGEHQYFKNSSVHHTYNRAITIHGTWSTLVQNNVLFDHIGHGLFLENGSEQNNVIKRNLVLSTRAPKEGEEVTPSDNQLSTVQNASPAAFWITNPHNTFVDNVAAGTEGTGFWFIFPRTPLAPSGTDPRFKDMVPYQETLIEFRGNTAHSCTSGFDVNDQLSQQHSIDANGAWAITTPAIIQDFTAYSNRLAGIYAGIGNRLPNVIYDNAVLADNRRHVFFATYHIVRDSLLVADSGNGLYTGSPAAYALYDGAGQLEDCHLVGYDAPNTSVFENIGGATKHVNHRFRGLTFDGAPRIEFEGSDRNDVEREAHRWIIVALDETGSLAGGAGRSVISDHPFMHTANTRAHAGWVHAFTTSDRFNHLKLHYDLTGTTKPAVSIRRKKSGQADVVFDDAFTTDPWHQVPVIVNDGYSYEVDYSGHFPSKQHIDLIQDDASAGDDFIVKIKAVGKLPQFQSTLGASKASMAALAASTTNAYFRDGATGDVSVKFVATGKTATVGLSWGS